MILCNAGFLISYQVLFKSFMPYSIQTATGKQLPSWCDDSLVGQIFWTILFSVAFIFPISIPRELSALRFTSAFSVCMSFYIVLVIFFECILSHGTSPSMSEGFQAAHNKKELSLPAVFNSLPLIIFAFMYQINIPAIYNELEVKTIQSMTKVLSYGTIGAGTLYTITGIFGFVAFATCGPLGYPINENADPPVPWTYEDIFKAQNILQAPFLTSDGKTPVAIYVCLFGILIVVAFASPFCVLPMKDSVEEVRGKGKLDKKQNIIWTFVLVLVCCILSCGVTSIGTVMTILGATTNSAIGFLLPVLFYLEVEKKGPKYTNVKIGAYLLFGFICISSITTLTLLVLRFVNGDGDEKN